MQQQTQQNRMKNIKTIGIVSVLGLAICGFTFAQSRHGGLRGHSASHHFKDAASAVEHLTENFPKFAAFDADKDGQLDATERESLAKAIAEGTLQLPAHTPPDGVTPGAGMMLNHIADMYAQFAAYDANHDGTLDATEQAALKNAIEKGELHGPDGQHLFSLGQSHH